MTISPEAKALIDAALEVSGYPTMGTMPWGRFDHAVEAYRASIAPKECRPAPGTKSDTLHWLKGHNNIGTLTVARWLKDEWQFFGAEKEASPANAHMWGWLYDSECISPGEQVEVTRQEITSLAMQHGRVSQISADDVERYTHAVLARFKSPKLREISDAKLDELAEWQAPPDHHSLVVGPETRAFARAIEAHIRGLDVS